MWPSFHLHSANEPFSEAERRNKNKHLRFTHSFRNIFENFAAYSIYVT